MAIQGTLENDVIGERYIIAGISCVNYGYLPKRSSVRRGSLAKDWHGVAEHLVQLMEVDSRRRTEDRVIINITQ